MHRLLIAHSSEPYIQSLVRRLEGHYEICACCDGLQTAAALESFAPDVLVLSTALPRKDALAVLTEAVHRPRFILVLTNYLPTQQESKLCRLGVCQVLLMPTADTVCAALNGCLDRPEPAPTAQQLVYAHLRRLSIPLHLEGFEQICTAVPLLLENPKHTLSKHIYPAVAGIHRVSDQRAVEHSIRNSIHAGFHDGEEAVWAEYFPPAPGGQIHCPKNRLFLYTLADLVRQALLTEALAPDCPPSSGHS